MLPRQYRLKRSREFARVRRYGRSSGNQVAALYVLPTRTPSIHVGFSVSKRVGNAVTRNRVKRLLREAVRAELPALVPGQDLVFIARPAAATARYPEVTSVVHSLLARTGALKPVAEASAHA